MDSSHTEISVPPPPPTRAPLSPPQNANSMFPRTFSVRRTKIWNTTFDFYIRATGEKTPSNIVAHYGPKKVDNDHPSMVLHAGPDDTSTPLASARYHHIDTPDTIDFTLDHFGLQDGENQQTWHQMRTSGTFNRKKLWRFDWGGQSFEWKRRGTEMPSFGFISIRLELVKVQTGEILATYAKKTYSLRNKGKFEIKKDGLGEVFELVVVITMLALVMHMTQRNRYDEEMDTGVYADFYPPDD